MARIDQLLSAAHVGDATGDSAFDLRAALRSAGHHADVYACQMDEALEGQALPFRDFPPPAADGLTLLHFALASPLTAALQACQGRRAIVYHNLTPPEQLLPWAPELARQTARGRGELEDLAASGAVDLAIGVSEFNRRDLEASGFRRTVTLPLPLDLRRYRVDLDPVLAERLRSGPRYVLSVGRIAPNKRLEQLLRTAAYFLRHVDPDVCFLIVGGSSGLETYEAALTQLHGDLGLDERVRFLGRVRHDVLVTLYTHASAYFCTSTHEGFCAPLLEAMHFGVPILARAAAAVPETLGGAGILFDEPDPASLAEMLQLLLIDTALRAHLRESGRSRVAEFAPERVSRRWVETLENVLGVTT